MQSCSSCGDDTLCQRRIYLLRQHRHHAALLSLYCAHQVDNTKRTTQKHNLLLNMPPNLMKSTHNTTVPPSTIQLPVLDLSSGEQNDDTNFANVKCFQVPTGNSTPLDPLSSEMITQGQQQVQYQEETTIRPVTQEIERRGKYLVHLLREVEDVIIGPVTQRDWKNSKVPSAARER